MSPYFYHAIDILGGIALFLYGVSQSTDAFRSTFSSHTREVMSRFAQKKPQAMLFGIVLSAIAQGSTVSTSIAIGFVDVGMLTLAGSVVVMMGASIGGTFVTFLISLDIVGFSPLLLALSFLMVRFGRGWVQKTGNVLHALSLILIGMLLLKLGVNPLLENESVRQVVVAVAKRPFTMFAVSVLGTAVLQSSASVMALAVTIAASGALPAAAIFPVALGSHLGSTVTMLLAAMGGRYNARMLGVATFVYKLVGVLAFLPLIGWAQALLDGLGFPMPSNIVLAQVLLVSLNASIFYPWPETLTKSAAFLLSRTRNVDLRVPVYLDDSLLEVPSLAVHLLSKEMIRLANYIEAFLQMLLFPEKNAPAIKAQLPEGIKELTEACERYMYEIRPPSIAEDPLGEREYRMISYAMLSFKEASHLVVGRFRDVIENNGIKKLSQEMGPSEWHTLTELLLESVRDSFHAFSLGAADLAQRAIDRDAQFGDIARRLRSRLLSRVRENGRRQESALMDFVIFAARLMHSALEVAHGEAAVRNGKETELTDFDQERVG